MDAISRMQNLIEAKRRERHVLDGEIKKFAKLPGADSCELTSLKKQKLRLRDEITEIGKQLEAALKAEEADKVQLLSAMVHQLPLNHAPKVPILATLKVSSG